jgi:hypothetical protein
MQFAFGSASTAGTTTRNSRAHKSHRVRGAPCPAPSVQGDTPRVLNAVCQKYLAPKIPKAPHPLKRYCLAIAPIAGAIDQHTSKVGLLNLARYEA